MTEIWFYHLERQPVDKVLPMLLEKALERGWRAVVQAATPERVEALDQALWTYDDASFLPHGTKRDGEAALQPVYLTDGDDDPNGAAIRIFLDGAEVMLSGSHYARVVLLFDGSDDLELASARRQWTVLKNAGHAVSYWRQGEDGRWLKNA